MINNEFHLIGYAISNFIKGGSQTFTYYTLKIEIDCYGKRSGQTKIAYVHVLPTNKVIDIYQQVRGKQVIVEGYIDFYTKDNITNVRCVANNISVLGNDNRGDFVANQNEQVPEQSQPAMEQPPVQETPAQDDLPF